MPAHQAHACQRERVWVHHAGVLPAQGGPLARGAGCWRGASALRGASACALSTVMSQLLRA